MFKYFVDPDVHWDLAGYQKQFLSLKPRLSELAFRVLWEIGLHDSEVLALHTKNL